MPFEGSEGVEGAEVPVTENEPNKNDVAQTQTATESSPSFEATVEAHAKTMTKQPPASIRDLPNELLSNIFGYFDTPKPSESALLEEPRLEITDSDTKDLKAISCVSKQWRRATITTLFKYARFIMSQPKNLQPVLQKCMTPFYEFVKSNDLRNVITSFTLLVHDKLIAATREEEKDFSKFWHSFFDVIDPVELLIVAPPAPLGLLTACHIYMEEAWCFDAPCHYLQLKRSLPPKEVSTASNVAEVSADYSTADQTHEVIEPVTENFSAHNVPADPQEADRLQRPGSSIYRAEKEINESPQAGASSSGSTVPHTSRSTSAANSSALFDIRPWKDLLLNEGSFVRAFATYEFWLRQPPSILPSLCGTDVPAHHGLISPTIRDFSYVGIFPMQSHFAALADHLPRVDRLYVQLVPRNNILDDHERMKNVEPTDLWMERNNCYAQFMRELFGAPPTGNYKYLRVFESGDAADRDAWLMAVEYVKRAGNWTVAGDGVFTRRPEDMVPENPDGGDEANSLLSVPLD